MNNLNSMHTNVNIGDIVYTLIFIGLILIGILSFILFMWTILKSQRNRMQSSTTIEQKLDRVIALLEEQAETRKHDK